MRFVEGVIKGLVDGLRIKPGKEPGQPERLCDYSVFFNFNIIPERPRATAPGMEIRQPDLLPGGQAPQLIAASSQNPAP